jgi:hypothetical protein
VVAGASFSAQHRLKHRDLPLDAGQGVDQAGLCHPVRAKAHQGAHGGRAGFEQRGSPRRGIRTSERIGHRRRQHAHPFIDEHSHILARMRDNFWHFHLVRQG